MDVRRVCLIFLGIIFTVASAAVSAPNRNFDHEVVFEGLDGPDDATAADLNGDRRLDIIVSTDNGMAWFQNGGGHRPQWQRVHPISGDPSRQGFMGLWTGDFDSDGDLDLLTADIHGGQAYIFENASRSATQWVKHDLPTWSKQGSHNLWVADINADGMPDIIGKHYERGSALEVWYNTLIKPALPSK